MLQGVRGLERFRREKAQLNGSSDRKGVGRKEKLPVAVFPASNAPRLLSLVMVLTRLLERAGVQLAEGAQLRTAGRG